MSNLPFATPSPADWRALAETALKDRDLASLVHLDADGLDVRPLYAAANAGEAVTAPAPPMPTAGRGTCGFWSRETMQSH